MAIFSNLNFIRSMSCVCAAVLSFNYAYGMKEVALSKTQQKAYTNAVAATERDLARLDAYSRAAFSTMFKALEADTLEIVKVDKITKQLNESIKATNIIGSNITKIANIRCEQPISIWKRVLRRGARPWKSNVSKDKKLHEMEKGLSWSRDDYSKGVTKKDVSEKFETDFNFFHVLQQHNHALMNAAFYLRLWQEEKDRDFYLKSLENLLKAQGIKNTLFLNDDEQQKQKSLDVSAKLKSHLNSIHDALNLKKIDEARDKEATSRGITTEDIVSLSHSVAQTLTEPAVLRTLVDDHKQLMTEPIVTKVLPKSVARVVDTMLDTEGNLNKNYPTLNSISLFGLGLVRDTLLLGTSFFVSKKVQESPSNTNAVRLGKECEFYMLHLRDRYKQQKDTELPRYFLNRYINNILKNRMGDKISENWRDELSYEKFRRKTFDVLSDEGTEKDRLPEQKNNKPTHENPKRLDFKSIFSLFPINPLPLFPVEEKSSSDKALEKELKKNDAALKLSRLYHAPEDYLCGSERETKPELYHFIQDRKYVFQEVMPKVFEEMAVLELLPDQICLFLLRAQLNREAEPYINALDDSKKQREEFLRKREKLSQQKQYFQKKATETGRQRVFSKARDFFSTIFSCIQFYYYEWWFHKSDSELKEVDVVVANLEEAIRKLQQSKQIQTLKQKYNNNDSYITDPLLEQKIKILAGYEPLFAFAIAPKKRDNESSRTGKILSFRNFCRTPELEDHVTLPLYRNVKKIFNQQRGAECGLYAILNGISLYDEDPDYTNSRIEELRLYVQKMRLAQKRKCAKLQAGEELDEDDDVAIATLMSGIRDDDKELDTVNCQWLDSQEEQRLIRLIGQEEKLFFITDLSCYLKGNRTINLNEARNIATIQKELNSGNDCKFAVILNDCKNSENHFLSGHRDGHYIALYIEQKNGKRSYTLANSYASIETETVFNDFMQVLFTRNFEKVVDHNHEETINDCLSNLAFRDVYTTKKLDRNTNRTTQLGIMQHKRDIESLVDWLLDNANKLYNLAQDEAFWSSGGFTDSKAIILDTLDAIESASNKLFEVYDPEKSIQQLVLNNDQLARIGELRAKLA